LVEAEGGRGEGEILFVRLRLEVALVLEGGRVGAELGNMALLELGSALAAVTWPPHGGGSSKRSAGPNHQRKTTFALPAVFIRLGVCCVGIRGARKGNERSAYLV
jgi:hypothetical protein